MQNIQSLYGLFRCPNHFYSFPALILAFLTLERSNFSRLPMTSCFPFQVLFFRQARHHTLKLHIYNSDYETDRNLEVSSKMLQKTPEHSNSKDCFKVLHKIHDPQWKHNLFQTTNQALIISTLIAGRVAVCIRNMKILVAWVTRNIAL